MMKPLIYTLTLLLIKTIAPVATFAVANTLCDRNCGETTVNYPFGFSPNCEFPLTCTTNTMEFQTFPIRNITSTNLLLSLPTNCHRTTDQIRPLFGKNHAITSENTFLLRNCTENTGAAAAPNGCVIPAGLISARFGPMDGCEVGENVSCYAAEWKVNGVLRYEDVVGDVRCTSLYSSFVVDLSGSNSSDGLSDVEIEFQAVQVGWWLTGTCRCDDNASCTRIGASGYRCKCNDGFVGDGFVDGDGCRNVSSFQRYSNDGKHKTNVIIGGVVGLTALVIILASFCHFCRRRSIHLKSRLCARRLLSEAGNTTVPFYSYKEIEKATNGFSEKQRLGTGAYGTVYEGKLHNNECVAIKKIKNRDLDGIEQVMNEIKLLSSVSHPNLVRLLGCCIENSEQILVFEFMPNGTLSQHLQRERGSVLPWTVRLTIAAETAQAIAYLHSVVNPPIYHRDIKSSNILLDYECKSKVADFGLSRMGMMETSHISTAPQGTPGYVDPQYHQNFHLSDKSDVYSFGVVLLEIITAMKVVDFNRPQTEVNLAALAIDKIGKGCVDEIIDPFIDIHRDAWTLSSVHKVAELAFRCLAYHRDMRPSMTEVAYELDQTRQTSWACLEESVCMGSYCSSPYDGSDRSLGGISAKMAVASRRIMVPQKAVDHLDALEEDTDSSPVSVHDPWFSEQSSPSMNSLLNNIVQ